MSAMNGLVLVLTSIGGLVPLAIFFIAITLSTIRLVSLFFYFENSRNLI